MNFSVAAPLATRVELLLFAHPEASEPYRVVELDQRHRSAEYWHVEVEGLGEGCCYGYRVFGPLQPGSHGFNPSKVDRKSTRLNSSHSSVSRMPSFA